MEQQKQEVKKKISAKTVIMGLIIIALLAILAWVVISGREKPVVAVEDRLGVQGNVITGSSSKSIAEMLAEAQREVDENSVGIQMDTIITVKKGESKVECLIENPARNKKPITVTITLAGTNEEIFKSGLIPAESYMQEFELIKPIETVGTYNAVATFKTYTTDGEPEDGQAALALTLNVI